MNAQNGLKFLSELCFGIINAAKDSYLLNSKVTFLNSGQNAAGICPFFLQCSGSRLHQIIPPPSSHMCNPVYDQDAMGKKLDPGKHPDRTGNYIVLRGRNQITCHILEPTLIISFHN